MPEWGKRFGKATDWVIEKMGEGFSSKVGEKIFDNVVDKGGSIYEFNTKLEDLKRNSTRLNNAASDIKTTVEIEELGGRKKRKREVNHWLKEEEVIQRDLRALEKEVQEKGNLCRFSCADSVGKLNKRVKEHIEQRYHFGELVVLDDERRGEKLLTSKMYGSAFQRNLKTIDCLMARNVQVIGIHGMPGARKTALAKHIHNKVLEETEDRVYWVEVSEGADIKLQDDISHAIGITFSGENNLDKRASRLHQELVQRKNFVLILDSLREDINLEKVMGNPFDEDGCRLIITTPSLRLCQRVCCQHVLEVKMEEDEAWDMFKEVYGQDTIFTPQHEEAVKLEVNKHRGFPQRIIDLAKHMKRTQLSPDSREWRYLQAELEEFH